jgi:Flp pilus assembly protein TadD
MRSALAFALLLALAGSASADGDAPAPGEPLAYRAGVAAIESGDFSKAIGLLKEHVAASPKDANGWNWLGYASRKSGDLDGAFAHYRRALALDPGHRGAHEYIGEAYLMARDLARAEEHLKILDRLCRLPCKEYRDLKQAIDRYRKAKP